jgi:hypothetical protein
MLHLSKSVDEPDLMYFPEKGILSILVHNILLLVYPEVQGPTHVPVTLQLRDVCLLSCILYLPYSNETHSHYLKNDPSCHYYSNLNHQKKNQNRHYYLNHRMYVRFGYCQSCNSRIDESGYCVCGGFGGLWTNIVYLIANGMHTRL